MTEESKRKGDEARPEEEQREEGLGTETEDGRTSGEEGLVEKAKEEIEKVKEDRDQ